MPRVRVELTTFRYLTWTASFNGFHNLTAFTGHFIRRSCFSYRFKVSVLPYDLTSKLAVVCFDYSRHGDCIVQGDGEVTIKCLLPAFSHEIGEVHVGCPFGVEQLVQLQGVGADRLEVLVQLFDVRRVVRKLLRQRWC